MMFYSLCENNTAATQWPRKLVIKTKKSATIVIISLALLQSFLNASTLPNRSRQLENVAANSSTINRQAKTISLVSQAFQYNHLKNKAQMTESPQSERPSLQPRFDTENLAEKDNSQQQQLESIEKRAFVMEFLKMLHEQYGSTNNVGPEKTKSKMEDRQTTINLANPMMTQLIEAIGADGDIKRLTDWVRSSFSLASLGEVTTQFVVGKLASVNCPAILRADNEESLVPRFLLFNEHFVDVPFELTINPDAKECLADAKFDPARKTLVLVHGYLAGYTIVDGVTNIKNRLLDLNKLANERVMESFVEASYRHSNKTGSSAQPNYVFTEDLDTKIRSQLYNVIIVDWFNGANPSPRANYVRAAVNAQVVGQLIARFLSALIVKCNTPANNIHILAHSLGCHVSGFTGKAMRAAGHRLGRITHLDPVGLCFGRLFSKPQYRLSPEDALDTQAVHVSLNIFDNPLDGAHSNFLVNGGRDQLGCGGQSELKNATTSSVSLLFDPAARFNPCSHLRALALFEDDHSSRPDQCQFVGYLCQNFDRFLAGKCGYCDSTNSQCSLMSLPPLRMNFYKTNMADTPIPESLLHSPSSILPPFAPNYNPHLANLPQGSLDLYSSRSLSIGQSLDTIWSGGNAATHQETSNSTQSKSAVKEASNTGPTMLTWESSLKEMVVAPPPSTNIESKSSALPETMFGAPAYIVGQLNGNELKKRRSMDRRFDSTIDGQRDKIAQALGKLRSETRFALAESLTNLRGHFTASGPGATSNGGDAEEMMQEGSSETDEQLDSTDPVTTTVAEMPEQQWPSFHYSSLAPTSLTATSSSPIQTTMPASTIQNNRTTSSKTSSNINDAETLQRLHSDGLDQIPIGGQRIPAGSLNMPLFFLGTGAVSPFCVNYYQFRILIAESRLIRVLQNQGLASNRLAPQLSQHTGGLVSAATTMQHRAQTASGRDMLHLTVKLTDTNGRFFKGFSLLEHSRWLPRIANDLAPEPQRQSLFVAQPHTNDPLIEITMLLNTTSSEPIKVGESILSYYFHPIVLADRIEVNYMSNISPDIRAKYSSLLCPVAINDRYQLIRYIECNKVSSGASK